MHVLRTRLFPLVLAGVACATPTPPAAVLAPAPVAPAPPPKPSAPASDEADNESLVRALRFEADGRVRETRTTVVTVRAAVPSEALTTVSAEFDPWVEVRPELQATVTTPDGRTLTLDPKTIAEAAVPKASNALSERRVVRASLPGVVQGAKVKLTITTAMHRPFVEGAGINGTVPLGYAMPVGELVVVLDAPTSMPLSHRVEGVAGLKPSRRVESDRTILTFERSNVAAVRIEEDAPWFDPYWPTLSYGSGASWNQTATAYAKIVEPMLDPTPVAAHAREAIGDARTVADKVNRIASWVHRRVRHASLSIGVAAMVPTAPVITLQRGWGDSTALAALLVAMARAVDVQADVAVLVLGWRTDVGELTPGVGAFNHAMVRVDGNPAKWLDPASPTLGLGELPPGVQARRALRLREGVLGLELTPRLTSADMLRAFTYEYDFVEGAPGRVRRTEINRGHAHHLRREMALKDPKAVVADLTDWGQTTYFPPDGGVSVSQSDATEVGQPYRTVTELLAEEASIGDWSGTVEVLSDQLLNGIPKHLKTADGPPRRASFEWLVPMRTEMEWQFRYPKAYAPVALPKDVQLALGPATVELKTVSSPGETRIRAVFDSHDALYTAAELQAFREKVGTAMAVVPRTFRIDNIVLSKLARGEVQGALLAAREGLRSQPGSPRRRAELAEALIAARAVPSARREVEQGLKAHPESPELNRVAAHVLAIDDSGLPAKGKDHAAAVAQAERAVALDPWSSRASDQLLDLSFVGDDWRPIGSGDQLAKVRTLLEGWRRIQRDGSRVHRFDSAYAETLFHLKADAELADPKLDLRGNLEMRALVMAARIRSQGPIVAELATAPDDVGKVEPAMLLRLMKEGDLAPARTWLEHLTKTKQFDAGRAATLAKVVSMQKSLADPQLQPVRRAYAALLVGDAARIAEATAAATPKAVGDVRDTLAGMQQQMHLMLGKTELSAEGFANIVVGGNTWSSETIEGVGTLLLSNSPPGMPRSPVLVVNGPKGPVVHLGSWRHTLLGHEATQCLKRGDRDCAARWVGIQLKINPVFERAFSGLATSMQHDEWIEFVAWSQGAEDDDGTPGGALHSLEAWLAREKREPVRPALIAALVEGYAATANGDGLLKMAAETSRGEEAVGADRRFRGLMILGRYREGAGLAASKLKASTDANERKQWSHKVSHAFAMAQDIPAAVRATKAALALDEVNPALVLREAWLQVFSKPTANVLSQAVLSTQVAQVDPMQRSLVLAVLAAESGQTDAALEHLSGAIVCLQDPKSIWSGAIHYALGRIFEQLDLRNEAIAELKRVDRNPHNTEYDVTSLAKARLAALTPPASVKQRTGTTGARP